MPTSIVYMINKSLEKKAGNTMARREKEADDEVDPLSGSGVLVDSGQSQASHSAALVDLKFLWNPPGVVGVVGAAVVVGVVVDVVASVVVVDAVVVVGVVASVVVVAAVVVVSPPSVAVVAAGVVASVVVAAGVVAQQTRACSSVQVGKVVVAGTVDVDAASREATQAAKRTTATFIFSIFSDFLSHFVCRDCGSYLCPAFLLGAAYQRVTWAEQGGLTTIRT